MAFDEILRQVDGVRDEVRGITRLGKVKAIDATALSLTVTIADQDVPGVRWIASYSPTVSDFVAITRTGESWLCLGKLSRDLTGPGYVSGTATIPGRALYYTLLEDGSWNWYTSSAIIQGNDPSDGVTLGGVAIFDPLAASVPVGATVVAAKLRMRRVDTEGFDLVSPQIRGHAQTGHPPDGPDPLTSVFISGYGPWPAGSLVRGQVGQWDLPSSWLTAWLAGTIKGVGVFAASIALYARFSEVSLVASYTVPG